MRDFLSYHRETLVISSAVLAMFLVLAFYTWIGAIIRNEYSTYKTKEQAEFSQLAARRASYTETRESLWYQTGYGSFNYNSSTPPGANNDAN
jgi:cell division protein FtsI/penicillin-binding protein 2